MYSLGYTKYMIQGGDWGSMAARVMAINYPSSVLAVHANMVAAALPVWYKNPLYLLQFFAWAVWTGGNKEGTLARLMWWRNNENGKSFLGPQLHIHDGNYT